MMPSMGHTQKLTASPAVQHEWLRRVEEEYRSASIAHHLTLWLIQIAVSPDLIRAGLRIAGDEVKHSELSHRAYLAAGGTAGLSLARETLGLRHQESEPLEHDVTRAAVRVFCLGETVAVPLFKALREGCTVPVARRVLDRVLRDEVRHREFGWTLLDWLLHMPMANTLRAVAAQELPAYFGRLRINYGARAKNLTVIDPADRAWGLMPPAEYATAVERTLERDWIPRFAAHGINAKKAWEISLSVVAPAQAPGASIGEVPGRARA
jgi:hypothetical protein